MEDKRLVCKECHQPFVWSAREQKYYQEQGFEHEPRNILIASGKRGK